MLNALVLALGAGCGARVRSARVLRCGRPAAPGAAIRRTGYSRAALRLTPFTPTRRFWSASWARHNDRITGFAVAARRRGWMLDWERRS